MHYVMNLQGHLQGEVDATCVQIGLGGRELHPEGLKNFPEIWVIRNL